MKKWYRSWFNSPYYHVLYAHRDHREAEKFIDNLCNRLNIKPNSKVLDACCGRGRHSIYLHKKNLEVIGIDLSHQNIQFAKKYEKAGLAFYEHDIRNLLYSNYFDFVFNLFTSFGYFKRENEDIKAIKALGRSLKPGGFLLIDFLNTQKVCNSINLKENKTVNGIEFKIEKRVEKGKIIKNIFFCDSGKEYKFKEEVKALMLSDFENFFNKAGLEIKAKFGDYSLNPYEPEISDRLILLAQKVNA